MKNQNPKPVRLNVTEKNEVATFIIRNIEKQLRDRYDAALKKESLVVGKSKEYKAMVGAIKAFNKRFRTDIDVSDYRVKSCVEERLHQNGHLRVLDGSQENAIREWVTLSAMDHKHLPKEIMSEGIRVFSSIYLGK